ncbi:MAG TPA: hypothetical protein DCY79_23300, partial [Planctomycetaceae bacterium]|nr:hypothetical protein [Planctomycetaceae bacterium]
EGKDGEGKDGEGKDGEGQSGEGQSGEGSEGGQQQQQQQQEGVPARKRIQAAEEKMKEAKQKLEEAKRKESVKAQREAEEELKQAIAELEEILRQLREEEIERMLAQLAGRFRKMKEMQLKVYEDTLRLAKVPSDKRGDDYPIRANKLSVAEQKIVLEADRALTLLLEEGSSVAFPETVQQMRDDMEDVAIRLRDTKVGRLTQGLEEEIIQTLDELIAALEKAQQDMEEQQQQQQQ